MEDSGGSNGGADGESEEGGVELVMDESVFWDKSVFCFFQSPLIFSIIARTSGSRSGLTVMKSSMALCKSFLSSFFFVSVISVMSIFKTSQICVRWSSLLTGPFLRALISGGIFEFSNVNRT